MSDSDDTDILLLIPPDFFASLRKEKSCPRQINNIPVEKPFLDETAPSELREFSYCSGYECCELIGGPMEVGYKSDTEAQMAADDALAMPAPSLSYQFLPPRRKSVAKCQREREELISPSDISTISNCTQQDCNTYKPLNSEKKRVGMAHSTPKCTQSSMNDRDTVGERRDGVLNEIDQFLDKRKLSTQSNIDRDSKPYGDDYPRHVHNGDFSKQTASSLPNASLHRISFEQQFANCDDATAVPADRVKLISLSEIWSQDLQGGGLGAHGPTNAMLQEEQLRRQHLEKTVHTLQSRLLEYQQRLSVAIEVDRSKDMALATAQAECNCLQKQLCQLREAVSKLETEHDQCSRKQENVQHELAQAVNLASKFQAKNEKLEAELDRISRKASEDNNAHKNQIDDLELKIQTGKTSVDFLHNELNKYKEKLAKAEYQNEKLQTHNEALEKDNSTLRHQKELLQDYHQKQKNRSDDLETQKKSLQEEIGTLTQAEADLKKKLELQQKTLKSHYQQQLEIVVAQKLREFQEQLDKVEENLRAEARDRERLIAERAVKQLELINEKNELELNLLQEKHNEEVELYRLQLANASKKIEDLELKLHAYKSKRADIAEKLHDVMETQWQKALEILTSPHQISHQNGSSTTQVQVPKNAEKSTDGDHENTPNTSKNNNCLAEIATPSSLDRLQAYIELLLSKSPSDFQKLDEILAMSAKSKNNGRMDNNTKRSNNGKPPWKA